MRCGDSLGLWKGKRRLSLSNSEEESWKTYKIHGVKRSPNFSTLPVTVMTRPGVGVWCKGASPIATTGLRESAT